MADETRWTVEITEAAVGRIVGEIDAVAVAQGQTGIAVTTTVGTTCCMLWAERHAAAVARLSSVGAPAESFLCAEAGTAFEEEATSLAFISAEGCGVGAL